jgi:competence protein ComFB
MPLQEQYDFDSLVNEAERLVIEEISRQLPRNPDLCTCEECVLDIAAYALNHVSPRYRASLLGSIYAARESGSSYQREVNRAVSEAIRRIRANPAHD